MVVLVMLVMLVMLALPVAAGASGTVPQGFVGMAGDGPLFSPQVNLAHQLDKMVASGVERLRVAFNWRTAQPYASWADVPADQRSQFSNGPGNVPTDFQATDQIVAQAAKHQLSLLPVVIYAPPWDASSQGNHVQPARDRPYGLYLTALVKRYGPQGSFWSSHSTLRAWRIRSWQIWNEPNLKYYWDTSPFAKSYVALLRVAHDAIKKVDPRATIVLGSLVNYGWRGLALIYKVHGSRDLFDAVSSNPYTSQPSGVITILGYMRRTMDRHGDHAKPLIATEVGWPSALGKTQQNFGFNTTERGQAKKLSELLPMLAANRSRLGLSSFYYYTWVSTDQPGSVSWNFSGLLGFDGSSGRISTKPAYSAFRRTALRLEGCKAKSTPLSCQ
jgi:hypothetical protein